MKTEVFTGEGMFQVWEYSVGHGRLLIRRAGTTGANQIDLLFVDVAHLDIATKFHNLAIEAFAMPGGHQHKEYQIRSGNSVGKVVAGNFVFKEYAGTYSDISPLWE